MTPNGKPLHSLRARLVITILICWVVPIVMIVAVAGFLLRLNYENEMARRLETDAGYTLRQLETHLDLAFTDSKSVSYDGVVRAAYRAWQQNGDKAALYRSVNDYLAQSFAREERYKAVFISFWEEVGIYPYVMSSGISGYSLPRSYHHSTEPAILDAMRDADTAIRFFAADNDLYIARNLLDNRFQPYASVVQLVDGQLLYDALSARHGGLLSIRARRESGFIVLECEHDSTLSAGDLRQISQMLSSDVADTTVSGQVGIRNVKQRLDLLYGKRGSLTLCQSGDDRVLARVRFPEDV